MSNKINYNLFIVYSYQLEKEKNISKNHRVKDFTITMLSNPK